MDIGGGFKNRVEVGGGGLRTGWPLEAGWGAGGGGGGHTGWMELEDGGG